MCVCMSVLSCLSFSYPACEISFEQLCSPLITPPHISCLLSSLFIISALTLYKLSILLSVLMFYAGAIVFIPASACVHLLLKIYLGSNTSIICYAGSDICSLQHCVPGHCAGLLSAFPCTAHFRSCEPCSYVSNASVC